MVLPRDVVGEHHGRHRSERHAIARESGCDELPLCCLADVGKAVVGFDDLPRPAVRDADVGQELLEPPLEPVEALRRVFHLSRLVIFAAEDHEVVVVASIDAQVVVRIAGIPEQRLGNRAARHPAANDVRRVRRELRLQQRCRQQSGLALQRHVRRDQHVLAVDAMAVRGRRRDRCALDLLDLGALVHLAALADAEEPQQRNRGICADGTSPGSRSARPG